MEGVGSPLGDQRRVKMSGASRSVESDPSEGSFEKSREGMDLRRMSGVRREVEVALEVQRRDVGLQVNMDKEFSEDAQTKESKISGSGENDPSTWSTAATRGKTWGRSMTKKVRGLRRSKKNKVGVGSSSGRERAIESAAQIITALETEPAAEFASSVTLFGAQNTAVLATIPNESVARTSCKIVEPAAVQTTLVEASATQETAIHTAAAENIAAPTVKNSDFAADQAAEDRDSNYCPPAETAKITPEITEFAVVQSAENRDSNCCQTATTTVARKSAPAEVSVTSPAVVQKSATSELAPTEPEPAAIQKSAPTEAPAAETTPAFATPAAVQKPATVVFAQTAQPTAVFTQTAQSPIEITETAQSPAEISETEQSPAEPAQPTAVFAQTAAKMAEYNMQAVATKPAQKPEVFA
ncbi:ice-structuring glycoprotein-like [Manihot esculenta]|uniref:ice-structuring glycoprotein-like n=1 Tax=Manihot esculenta TaxID=3983 RepID=UPI001CC66A4D|nr:ice-structuring glycoprotein-like [Manihot esculenta]